MSIPSGPGGGQQQPTQPPKRPPAQQRGAAESESSGGGAQKECPHCGAAMPADATRCPTCGTSDVGTTSGGSPQVSDGPATEKGNAPGAEKGNADTIPCPTCGEPRPRNSETCPHCGLK